MRKKENKFHSNAASLVSQLDAFVSSQPSWFILADGDKSCHQQTCNGQRAVSFF